MNESQIFATALDLADPADRAAYLDRACAGDPELRAAVEALLRARASDPDFLECPAVTLGDTADLPATAPTAGATRTERPGLVLAGRYKLLEVVGEGGMGTIWMAEQTEPVKRRVAVKLIKPGMDSKAVLARFEAERQALALMDHPNIAKVHDAGVAPDGRPFFVMELVKGVPITRYCDEHRLTPRQRLELFVPVCQAIQHAHQKGVIHRDLKPSNVLVALYDDRPVPKVIDFGVAKATGTPLTEQTLQTGFGVVVGTVEYMSPEQATFNQLDIDTRSDVYSLGVLLYELLAGSPPFTARELERAGALEMLRMIREVEPARPTARLSTADGLPTLAANRGTEPAKLTRLVRGELDWIVMKALEKDRSRRYETANGLALDVQRYLADEPVLACPPSAGYRLRKFARRNKGRLAVAAGVVLAVTVAAGSIGWAVSDRVARRAHAEQAEEARLARVDGRVRNLLNASRSLVAEDRLPAARERMAQARAELGNDGPALADLAAEVEAGESALDRFQQFLHLVDRTYEVKTAPLAEPVLAPADSGGASGSPASAAMADMRRQALADPYRVQALQSYDVLDRDDWANTLAGGVLGPRQVEQVRNLVYEELVWMAAELVRWRREPRSGQMLSAEAAARQALTYLARAETARPPTPLCFVMRAECHKRLGDEAAAQADRQRAAQAPATLATDHLVRGQDAVCANQLAEGVRAFEAALRLEPNHYWALLWLGHCLCDLGEGPADFGAAVRVFTGCILKRPDHAHAYYCRGNAHSRLHRYDDALADFTRALELDPVNVRAWHGRGADHWRTKQWDKAFADFDKAIALDPTHAPSWTGRGSTRFMMGRTAEAFADYDKAIELDPKLAVAWHNRGWAYQELGQSAKALPDLTTAIELDPALALAWHNRGLAHNRLNRPREALVDFDKAIALDPTSAHAWYNRGVVHNKLNQTAKAMADFDKALALDSKLKNAWLNRGALYQLLNQPAKALADFDQAIEVDPKYALAWFNRGIVRHELGQSSKALADFDRAIELGLPPQMMVRAFLERAQVHAQLGHVELARTDFQAVVQRAPAHAGAQSQVAWLLVTCADARLRDPEQAVASAKKAVQLESDVGQHWGTLGVAQYRSGDFKAAIAAIEKSIELHKSAEAADRFFLAMAHHRLGNRDEARKLYQQAIEWLESNTERLAKGKRLADERRRFREEAEEVLELKKK